MAGVASAAIIEGSLIIGLDDGSIIRAGYVQGPQGLKGDPGPIGATGDRGTDGNTIITIAGIPGNEIGKDGDYAINNRDWFIFGPKSGGIWGKGKSMLPQAKDMVVNGRGTEGSGTGGGSMGGGGGGGGAGGPDGPIFTNTVRLTDPTRTLLSTKEGYRVLPDPGAGKRTQQDANQWAFGDVFDRIDQTIPVPIGENPRILNTVGSGSTAAKTILPFTSTTATNGYAALPVSLDGIEGAISLLTEKVSVVETGVVQARVDVAGNAGEIEALKLDQAEQNTKIEALEASQVVQDNQIIELEEEIESLAPSLDRGKWNLAELGDVHSCCWLNMPWALVQTVFIAKSSMHNVWLQLMATLRKI